MIYMIKLALALKINYSAVLNLHNLTSDFLFFSFFLRRFFLGDFLDEFDSFFKI